MNAFALESLAFGQADGDTEFIKGEIVNEFTRDNSEGLKRVKKFKDSISFTLAKLERTGSGFLNDRDRSACAELKKNMKLYLFTDRRIFEQLSRIYKARENRSKDLKKHEAMLVELRNVDVGVLERAEVSKRDWDSIQLLLDVDKDIFHEEAKLHMTNYIDTNPFS